MEDLIGVFQRAREALSHPGNDFAWSSWAGVEDAVGEIDDIIPKLRADAIPDRTQMEVLFAPTGPIQGVSLSSGWAQGFLKLAHDFDVATGRIQR